MYIIIIEINYKKFYVKKIKEKEEIAVVYGFGDNGIKRR